MKKFKINVHKKLSRYFSCFYFCFYFFISSHVHALDSIEFDLQAYHSFIQSFPEEKQHKVRSIIGLYEYKPRVVQLITKPSEKLDWPAYKNLLINQRRLDAGKDFIQQNSKTLLKLYDKYGVPPRYLTALIGVESSYGKYTGSWKVGDALKTLSFTKDYRRKKFFQSELRVFIEKILLNQIDIEQKGSYAGAFGLTQFMPSSYDQYAVSYKSQRRQGDLNKLEDALASTAAYLKRHGWKSGQRVALKIPQPGQLLQLEKSSRSHPKPQYNSHDYSELEFLGPVKFSCLDLENCDELWIGFDNFFALTRYNHSTNYAMVIESIAQELEETECAQFGCLLS